MQKKNLVIIAIGASAGGMEAIHTLFDYTPTDAVSYVIIQHLSPDYKSFMAELLVKHSRLKIFKADDGMEVISNCVYVMPEGKDMTIAGGKLVLKDRKKNAPNSAVDIFFNSLAEDLGSRSIGIILSGNGSDGTKGIAAIKKVGGMVIVQDPETTDFDSMPNSAIASGAYDYILPPRLIPQQIVDYIEHRTLAEALLDPESNPDEAALEEVIALVKQHTPMDFSDYKRPTIIRRITRRMIANNTHSLTNYIALLHADPAEIDILAKEFLISVTKFFRDPDALKVISQRVIPDMIGNKLLTDTLKVWVIGCATGEEAYTLAILIREHVIRINKDLEVKIFATDIDKEALAKASKGLYPESISTDVSAQRLETFFIKEEQGYKVKEEVRKMIIFAHHDIIQQPPFVKIDLISCRNILIYFNPTLQKRVFSTIHFCLNIGGYLFLGPSEGIGDLKNMFREVDKKWKIYENMEARYKMEFNHFAPQRLEVKRKHQPSQAFKSLNASLPDQLAKIIHQSHLEETGFLAGVCIDEQWKIIQPFGVFDKYLLPKLFNDNLLELLPAELAVATGTAIRQAAAADKKVSIRQVKFRENGSVRAVHVLVKPFNYEDSAMQHVSLVYFKEEKSDKSAQEINEVFDKDQHTNRYLIEIEEELAETRVKLKLAYQALEESEDSIQSYHEELISGNEELQSSNEELQSMNEELNTVNQQYQSKIKELAELNDDLNNYFRSTHNSQLYVDENLIIKKFTPISMKQINIRASDIGRSITDLSANIKFSSLIEDIKSVIATMTGIEKQVETLDGKWYNMVVLPYVRSQTGKTDGAIITFNDITDLIKSKEVAEVVNKELVRINEEHDTFIFSVSHDLKAPLSNMEGLLAVMLDSDDPAEVKYVKKSLLLAVDQLKETVDELSHITILENEAESVENVNLTELIKEVKISISGMLLHAKPKLTLDLKENEIHFSKKYLRSILFNLLSNAIKYRSPDRPLKVAISTYKMDDYIVLTVQDNGLGIASEKTGELFSKFKRVHDLDAKVEGTGIGLYLVKKIMINTGGKIELESKTGEGSCFKVFFRV